MLEKKMEVIKMPTHDQIYNNQADMYEKMISKQPSLSEVINEMRPYRNLDVVDLGAGSGRFSTYLASEANSLICTDSSRAMLDILEQKLSDVKLGNWTTVVADHRNLPIRNSSIDLVVSGWSICYLTSSDTPDWQNNLKAIMSEIDRILRKDGTIIIFETLGTGYEQPNPPDFLTQYYRLLEEEYGFSHKAMRTDYTFDSRSEAEELTGFFFGEEFAAKVASNHWTVVPECAGIWWKHK
jgi:ubiquinone/menaquinone biosynthesis C-methylase UbiE